ncbi:MAG: Fe-S cluster assembly protein SufD [Bacteroidia bacterium]|nr:Fe-S cluster assembly protein SufD [Bacteroidia bacterium]HPE86227.1 Fe-S cluster assembly protein SufD [Bacteroidales bacterium]
MQTTQKSIKERIIHYVENHSGEILQNDPPEMAQLRRKAFQLFKTQGIPGRNLESWKNTDIQSILDQEYHCSPEPESRKINVETFFHCNIPDLDTLMVNTLNGYYIYRHSPLKKHPNGVIIGSLAEAKKQYPQLVDENYGKCAIDTIDGMISLNTALANDGVFVYVPDNVEMKEAIQIVHINHNEERLLTNVRNLIVVGKNSSLTLVHCDDSYTKQAAFINSLTEIIVKQNAVVDHYKLQNLNNNTTLINQVFFSQFADSRVHSVAMTLNGGLIRNYAHTRFHEPGAEANVLGLYLVDKTQNVDNQVYINHTAPNCTSNELFKGLIDDQAKAIFNGHIKVHRNAQKTIAYQNNKNLLLTDKARIVAKPFLEIYADDVKCSHGATVGQLDNDALFYLMSRGISKESARMLLMYAFAAEVINEIKIDVLRNQIDDMVKKRLHGELDICETCVLHCQNREREITFPIDMSKI